MEIQSRDSLAPANCKTVNLLSRREPIEPGEQHDIPGPLWVTETQGSYRLLWTETAVDHQNQQPVLLINEPDVPDWRLSLRLWKRYGDWSPLEKARIVRYLLEEGIAREEVLEVMDTMLDLPRSEDWLDCYRSIPESPSSVRGALHEGRLDPRHVHFARRMPDKLQEPILASLGEQAIHLSVQEVRKLMEAFRRLDVDEYRTVKDWLNDTTGKEDQARQRGRDFLEDVCDRAYPRTRRRREQFRETLRDLDLPGEISVSPPNNFEGDYLDVRIRIRRDDSLEEWAEVLTQCQPLLDYV